MAKFKIDELSCIVDILIKIAINTYKENGNVN